MTKKLTKHDHKRILSPELYKNARKGKRGRGRDIQKIVNTRLTSKCYIELIYLIKEIGVSRSNFVRYAILKAMEEVNTQIRKENKD